MCAVGCCRAEGGCWCRTGLCPSSWAHPAATTCLAILWLVTQQQPTSYETPQEAFAEEQLCSFQHPWWRTGAAPEAEAVKEAGVSTPIIDWHLHQIQARHGWTAGITSASFTGLCGGQVQAVVLRSAQSWLLQLEAGADGAWWQRPLHAGHSSWHGTL